MDIYQLADRYTYLKESSIKHNKNYLFSKKGQYFFDENLSIYYHSSINTLTKYNTDKKESIAIKPIQITDEGHYQSIVLDDLEFIYPFACRNELGLIVQKHFTLLLILYN